MIEKNLSFINQKLHDVFNIRGKNPEHDTELFQEILDQVRDYFSVPKSLPCTCNKASCDCPQHTQSPTQEETECPACTDELKYVLPQPVQHTCQKMEETECCSLCGTVLNGKITNRLEPHECSTYHKPRTP